MLARIGIAAAAMGTIISSLVFYGWWNPAYLPIPILSIALNYWIARQIAYATGPRSRGLMIAGIVANLLVLCYFKYADFLLAIVDGHTPTPPNVPLALSFTTFVQIAFLAYVYQRRHYVDFIPYALFVAFFPHLIAGPIVRWGSFGRQLGEGARYKLDWENVALGLTIFTFGLAKKVMVADMLAPHVGILFGAAAHGEPVTALASWGGAVAFILQIYFDFSGYSDMAVGLGLLFNFRLPINFAAPLRATNMFDLWRRWHVTLSRLARDLIYVPLSRGDTGTLRRSANLFLTMIVIGIWHGAGWTFIAWGAFNGVLLLINQAWRSAWGQGGKTAGGRLAAWALTFTGFTIGGVFFRAPDMETAWHLLNAMAGFGQAPAAASLTPVLSQWMIGHGFLSEAFVRSWFGTSWSVYATIATIVALAIALLVPDTMELTNYREGEPQSNWRRTVKFLAWRPSLPSLAVTAIIFVAAATLIGRVNEFIYYQF